MDKQSAAWARTHLERIGRSLDALDALIRDWGEELKEIDVALEHAEKAAK